MKNTTTRRALLTSLVSIVICIVMLMGTTFAWFTDSVVSGRNKIVAGNLDIEFTHLNNDTQQPIDDNSVLFSGMTQAGDTVSETFTLKNNGSLPLSYKLMLTAYADAAAQDALVFGVTDSVGNISAITSWESLNEPVSVGTLASGAEKSFVVAVKWPAASGVSTAASQSSVQFGVNLAVGQANEVLGSFGDDTHVNQQLMLSLFEAGGDIALAGTVDGDNTEYPWGKDENPQYTAEYFVTDDVTALTGGNILLNGAKKFGFFAYDVRSITGTVFEGDNESDLYIQNTQYATELNNISVRSEGGSGIYVESAKRPVVINGATVTQSGLKDGYLAQYETAVAVSMGSSVVINGGSYSSTGNAVYVYNTGGSVVINGGTFKGNILADAGEIVINAGSFDSDPARFGNNVTVTGKVTNNDDGTWTVAPYDVDSADKFKNKLDDGKSVRLTGNIEVAGKLALDSSLLIDLGGKTLTSKAVDTTALLANGDAYVSVINGTLSVPGGYVAGVFGKGKMYVNNCMLSGKYGFGMNGDKTSADAAALFVDSEIVITSAYNAAYISAPGTFTFVRTRLVGGAGMLIRSGDVTVDGCTVVANGYATPDPQPCFYVNEDVADNGITLNGVKYWSEKSQNASTGDGIVIVDRSGESYELRSVTVTNSTLSAAKFSNNAPAAYAIRYFDKNASDKQKATLTVSGNTYAVGVTTIPS